MQGILQADKEDCISEKLPVYLWAGSEKNDAPENIYLLIRSQR